MLTTGLTAATHSDTTNLKVEIKQRVTNHLGVLQISKKIARDIALRMTKRVTTGPIP
jgi:hypothetical protein